MKKEMKPKIKGFLKIIDKNSKEVLLDKSNAINFETMSLALARSLGNKDNGPIYSMAFGNGAATVDNFGTITYLDPNVTSLTSTLYNESFAKVVDDSSAFNLDPANNFIVIEHQNNKFYSDIVVTCTLDYGEPAGQEAFDTSTTFEGDFVFDELGLKTQDGLLLTHVVFFPIQKSLNRQIEVQYTIRISMA